MKNTIKLVIVLTVALFSGFATTTNAQILTNGYVVSNSVPQGTLFKWRAVWY